MRILPKLLWRFGISLEIVNRRKFDAERKMNDRHYSPYYHAPRCEHCGASPLIFNAGRYIGNGEWEAVCYACKKPAKGTNEPSPDVPRYVGRVVP